MCRGEAGSQSELRGKRRERVIIKANGRPSLEILRLLGLSRLGELGSCWKKCYSSTSSRKKKVPQRGFHLNMPCQLGCQTHVQPPKIPPPKNCHIPLLCLFAQHPAPSCCRSRPLLPKIIGARGRSSPRRQSLGVDNPRLPVISWDCVPYRLRYGLFCTAVQHPACHYVIPAWWARTHVAPYLRRSACLAASCARGCAAAVSEAAGGSCLWSCQPTARVSCLLPSTHYPWHPTTRHGGIWTEPSGPDTSIHPDLLS